MKLPVTLGANNRRLDWQTEQAAYSRPRQIEQFHVLSRVKMVMKTNSKGCQSSHSYYHPVPKATSLAEQVYVHRVYPPVAHAPAQTLKGTQRVQLLHLAG